MKKDSRILYCDCGFAEILPSQVRHKVHGWLKESGLPYIAIRDLCELASRKDPLLAELADSAELTIAACHPRAVKWLFEAGGGSWIDSWSPDGRHLLFERFVPERGSDLWILPLDGTRKAVPFLETPANETHAAFSPDGRLVAYVSDEGGMPQIFVRTFPASGSRWQVSLSGGDWAAWSADGKELFYVGLDRVLQAVPITGTSPFSFGGPVPLFRMRVPQPAITSNRTYFAPAPDGRRFLVNQLVGTSGGSRIEVLMNWNPQRGRP